MAWAEQQRQQPRKYRHATTSRRPPVEIPCDACGRLYLEHQSRLDRFKTHYCSRDCYAVGKRGRTASEETRKKMSEAQAGEKSNTWKGGVSRQHRRGYRSEQFKRWRSGVFARDQHTCRDCGQVGGFLTAHHIEPFALNPDLRYEVSNGVTLCETCHARRDPHFYRTRPKATKARVDKKGG